MVANGQGLDALQHLQAHTRETREISLVFASRGVDNNHHRHPAVFEHHRTTCQLRHDGNDGENCSLIVCFRRGSHGEHFWNCITTPSVRIPKTLNLGRATVDLKPWEGDLPAQGVTDRELVKISNQLGGFDLIRP